jgi:AraC-like DNA-binding protein
VQRARDRDDFVASPLGRYLIGESWLFYYIDPHLSGLVFWGRIRAADAEAAARISPDVHGVAQKPHVALIDTRRVEHVEPTVYAVTSAYVTRNRDRLRAISDRLAIVHSPGIIGTIATGFFQLVPPPYPVRVFGDRPAALDWLEQSASEPMFREIDRIIDDALHSSPIQRDLRAILTRDLRGADLENAARALGTSERSLQRRLAEQDTSFQRELALARVSAAKKLLLETDVSLTEIAFDVGCASLPTFSALFRRVVGESPSQWRTRERERTL